MIPLYHYSPITGEYIAQSEARPDPVAKNPLVPANATTKAPPDFSTGQMAVFSDGEWSLVDDHRGPWWSSDGQEHVVSGLGNRRPDGAITTRPPRPGAIHDGSRWTDPPAFANLGEAKAAIRAAINAADQAVTDGVPAAERGTWPFQEAAARAHQGGTATAEQGAMLASLNMASEETLDELAAKIIAKAQLFHALSAALVGLRRRADAALEAAPDAYALQSIVEAAQAEIQTLIGA